MHTTCLIARRAALGRLGGRQFAAHAFMCACRNKPICADMHMAAREQGIIRWRGLFKIRALPAGACVQANYAMAAVRVIGMQAAQPCHHKGKGARCTTRHGNAIGQVGSGSATTHGPQSQMRRGANEPAGLQRAVRDKPRPKAAAHMSGDGIPMTDGTPSRSALRRARVVQGRLHALLASACSKLLAARPRGAAGAQGEGNGITVGVLEVCRTRQLGPRGRRSGGEASN